MSSAATGQKATVQQAVAEHWGDTFQIDRLVSDSENKTFFGNLVAAEGKEQELIMGSARFIARLVPSPEKNEDRVQTELDLLTEVKKYVQEYKIRTCTPITTRSGKSFMTLDVEEAQQQDPSTAAEGEEREQIQKKNDAIKKVPHILLLMSFCPGRPVAVYTWEAMKNKEIFMALGRWCGRFHTLSRKHLSVEGSSLAGKVRPYTEIQDRIMAEAPVDPADLALQGNKDRWGIIHGDVDYNFNLMPSAKANGEEDESASDDQKQNGPFECAMFDWDWNMMSWYAYDLALPLQGAHMAQVGGLPGAGDIGFSNREEMKEWLLEGYESTSLLCDGSRDKVDRAHLDRMILLRRQFYFRFADREKDSPKFGGFAKYVHQYQAKCEELEKKLKEQQE